MKARKMWAHLPNYNPASCMFHSYKADKYHKCVFVQPLDAESVEELRFKVEDSLLNLDVSESLVGRADLTRSNYYQASVVVLRALGITAKRPRAKKGKKL